MKRIEYIDAMRGFNMILIVMAHIVIFSYGCISGFSWSPLFTVFRLPIFFFISGFVMYKIDRVWSVKATFHYLKDKAKVLLIPFIAFFSLYTYYIKGDFWEGLCYDMKNGYWFTFALFEYYAIYVLIMLFLSNTFTAIRGGKIVLFSLSLFLIWLCRPDVYHDACPNIFGVSRLRYFIFFFAGTLAKEYFSNFQRLLDNRYFIGAVISIFTLTELYGVERGRFIIGGFCGLIIAFAFFRKYEARFDRSTYIGRGLQYIGTRTLDIYLLHYFFLPHNLQVFGKFFSDFNNPTIELFVSLFIALMIIALCLIASNIIRLSPLLAHWLLGVKHTK